MIHLFEARKNVAYYFGEGKKIGRMYQERKVK